MTFEIQPARLRDLNTLKQLEDEVFKDDAWPVLDILYVLLMPGTVNIKAVSGRKIVGFITAEEPMFENHAGINSLGVSLDFRRQGVGIALMRAAEKRLKRTRIRLCVRQSNEGAIDLYVKLGYRKVEVRHQYYTDGEDAYVMMKEREISSSARR